jgi:hypothetical protein
MIFEDLDVEPVLRVVVVKIALKADEPMYQWLPHI